MILRRLTFTGTSVRWTNPTDFTDTVKESVIIQPKNISSIKLMNTNVQIKLNRRRLLNPLAEGADPCCDYIPRYEDMSASFSYSASTAAGVEGDKLIADLFSVVTQTKPEFKNGFPSVDTVITIT